MSVLFFLFQLFYVLTTDVKRLDTVPIGIETILIFIFIFIFFYEFSKNPHNLYIYNHYCFWIGVGILIYLGGSFFFFILIDHLNKDQVATFGDLTYIAEIIKNILFCIALFVFARNLKEKTNKTSSVPYLDMV